MNRGPACSLDPAFEYAIYLGSTLGAYPPAVCPVASSSSTSTATSSIQTTSVSSVSSAPLSSTSTTTSSTTSASTTSTSSSVSQVTVAPSPSTLAATGPTCPGSDQTIYVDAAGDTFQIECFHMLNPRHTHHKHSPLDNKRQALATAFVTCINACSAVTICLSLLYTPPTGSCLLFTIDVLPQSSLHWGAQLRALANGLPVQSTNGATTVVDINAVIEYADCSAALFEGCPVTIVCTTGKCGVTSGICGACSVLSSSLVGVGSGLSWFGSGSGVGTGSGSVGTALGNGTSVKTASSSAYATVVTAGAVGIFSSKLVVVFSVIIVAALIV